MTDLSFDGDNASFLSDLKVKIRSAQTRAMMSVNAELVQLYWQVGHDLLESQKISKWGKLKTGERTWALRPNLQPIHGKKFEVSPRKWG